MAVSTDPLDRARIGVVSADTGDRYRAPTSNAALRLAQALGDIAPEAAKVGTALAQQLQDKREAEAKRDAVIASGRELSDAVRLGLIKPTQNPWYVSAYHRESAAIRGQDALSKLQTDSSQWEERNDPAKFAERWHTEVGHLMEQFGGDQDSIKGFSAAEAQATQQALATNTAQNVKRMEAEREQNLSALAAQSLADAVRAGGGHISGSQAAAVLAPSKSQWVSTGGSLDDWNKLVIRAVTTASYSIRSPGLLDLLKAPELVNGPREGDDSRYGDGTDTETHSDPLPHVAEGPAVSTQGGVRLAMPVQGGRVTETYEGHLKRGSHGVDIAVPVGTKVSTMLTGTAQVGHDARSGLYVRVVSPDGKIVTSFAHLSVAQVENGQHVPAGAIIGRAGTTGHSKGPHVHWRVKVDGQDVDPLSYQPPAEASEAPAVQAAAEAPALTPDDAPAPMTLSRGPSLYDIAGVADSVESDRYRIQASVNSEAQDRLQRITNERKLKGLEATDRLFQTYGTSILTGGIDVPTIVKDLSGAGYKPQEIAEAINNVRGVVTDSAGLGSARLSLNDTNPTKSKELFDLAVEGRTKGWSEDYEDRVGKAVLAGDLSPSDGATMVGEAVSKSHSDRAEARTVNGGPAGSKIKSYNALTQRVTSLADLAQNQSSKVSRRAMTEGERKYLRSVLRRTMNSYLELHPGDYPGAYQAGRDWVAAFLNDLARKESAAKQRPTASASPQPASSAGGNPRR